MTINFIDAITAANAENKALTFTTFKSYCTGDAADNKAMHAAFDGYRADAAALVSSVVDYMAAAENSEQGDSAAVIATAKTYLARYSTDKKQLVSMLFNVADGENNAAAALRIASRLYPIAKNGLTKQVDGHRRGAINLNADGKATATIMAALEQWALDRFNGEKAQNAAALVADKKARKEEQARRRAEKAKAAAEKAEQEKQPAAVKADAKKPAAKKANKPAAKAAA